MDGMLPIHWALRNQNKGAHEAVEMLLEAFPDSALSDPYGLGGLGMRHSWKEVVSVLSSPDNLLGRQATLSSCVLPVARVWADGHRKSDTGRQIKALATHYTPAFQQSVQDTRSLCPCHQLKLMYFNVLRKRVARLYSRSEKRSSKAYSLKRLYSQPLLLLLIIYKN
jgi:hypothetical protein